jgi:hypothetical protein
MFIIGFVGEQLRYFAGGKDTNADDYDFERGILETIRDALTLAEADHFTPSRARWCSERRSKKLNHGA